MKLRYLILVLPLVLQGCLVSQPIAQLPTLESLPDITPSLDVSAYLQKYQGEEGVYVYFTHQIEHEQRFGIMYEWHYHEWQSYAYVIIDPTVQRLTTTRFSRKPDQLYMRMTLPSGEVHTYGPNDLQQEEDGEGGTRFAFVYPRVVPGTLIEEGIEYYSNHGGPIDHEVPLQFTIPCESLSVSYTCPKWWEIQTKRIAPEQFVPLARGTDEAKDKQMVTYTATDIPARRPERFAPYFKESAHYLKLRAAFLRIGDQFTYRCRDSWTELARDFTNNLIPRSPKDSRPLVRTIDSVVADAASAIDTIRTLARFLQSQIALSVSGDRKTYADVLSERKGNVFELSGLMDYALYKLGIDAHLLLIHSAEDGYFDPQYVDLDQVAYPGIVVNVDTLSYLVFPYRDDIPIGYIPDAFLGQSALMVDLGSEARFMTLPESDPLRDDLARILVLALDSTGPIQIDESIRMEGVAAHDGRELFRLLQGADLTTAIEDYLERSVSDFVIDTFYVDHLNDPDLPLLLHLQYTVDNRVTLAGPEVVVQTAGLLTPVPSVDRIVPAGARQNPIHLLRERSWETRATLQTPQHWRLTASPEPVSMSNPFGSVQVAYTESPGSVDVVMTVSVNRVEAPGEDIGQLQELIGEKAFWDVPALIFRSGAE